MPAPFAGKSAPTALPLRSHCAPTALQRRRCGCGGDVL